MSSKRSEEPEGRRQNRPPVLVQGNLAPVFRIHRTNIILYDRMNISGIIEILQWKGRNVCQKLS